MAIMIPGIQEKDDFNSSGGELLLWERLQLLPDSYYIFHSVRWNEKRRRNSYQSREYVEWGEADFTIFHPQYGIIVFEVKDGLISYKRDRGWIQTNRKTGFESYIDPLAQAEKSKYHFLSLIQDKFGGASPYSLCSAVWFTAADRNSVTGDLPLSYKDDIVLWSNDLSSKEQVEMAIRKVYRFYDAKPVESSEDLTNKILDTLAPEFDCFQSLRGRALASKAMFHRMTQEQSYLLDYLEEQETAAIHGVAGTGKTVLAVQKAQRLADKEKVLFLCFNRFLRDHLETAYPNPNIAYYNLESLYVTKTRAMLPPDPNQRDEMIADFLLDWQSYQLNYKHIIIDEGQDFKDFHLQALHEMAEEIGGCFYVFFDKNQFVQGLEYPQWLDRMDCRLVLSRNCRNTREIAITSTRPIGISEDKIKMRHEDLSEQYIAPPKPNFYFASDPNQLKTYLIKLLSKYTRAGISKENIVVLSCKREGDSILTDRDLILNTNYALSKTKEEKKILFTTVRKFKGLEADVVIMIDVDGSVFEHEKERNAFYVGTSRATTFLDFVTVASPQELAIALSGNSSLKGPLCLKAIRDGLKVRIGAQSDFD